MRKEQLQTMKKSLGIGLGILGGVLAVGAIAGITLACNSQARDYVQNAVQNVVNDDALDLSKTKIEFDLDLNKAQKAAQGVQADEETIGEWKLCFAITGLPEGVSEQDVMLQTNIIRGDTQKAYFLAEVGDEVVNQYEGVSHRSGDDFALAHDLYKKAGEDKYTVRTYWIAHPSVYCDTKITFSYDGTKAASSQVQEPSSSSAE